jgi:hypothetical protein
LDTSGREGLNGLYYHEGNRQQATAGGNFFSLVFFWNMMFRNRRNMGMSERAYFTKDMSFMRNDAMRLFIIFRKLLGNIFCYTKRLLGLHLDDVTLGMDR